MNIYEAYKQFRAPVYSTYEPHKVICWPSAKACLAQARWLGYRLEIDDAWGAEGGYECGEHEAGQDYSAGDSRVRLVACLDVCADFDDLCGDCYDPDVNTDIKPETLEQEKIYFLEKVNSDGVWYYEAQYWSGDEWVITDGIGGIIGQDLHDYESDLKRSALDALDEAIEKECRDLERLRPDMYQTS